MNKRLLLVVGEKFAPFTAGKDAMTISHLFSLLDNPSRLLPSHSQLVFVPGQGLSDLDVETILQRVDNPGVTQKFNFDLWYRLPKRASSLQSHKHHPENTLISTPERISEDLFELQLMIDDDCELMRDHQSGQHIQGMVLLEAARQSLLAVTEAFFLEDNQKRFSFIFNRIGVNFNNFAFPMSARLKYKILEKDIHNSKRLGFSVDINIEQCGTVTAACDMSFTAYESKRIIAREDSVANKTMDGYLTALSASLENDVQTQVKIA